MGAVENEANKQMSSSSPAEIITIATEGSKGGFQS